MSEWVSQSVSLFVCLFVCLFVNDAIKRIIEAKSNFKTILFLSQTLPLNNQSMWYIANAREFPKKKRQESATDICVGYCIHIKLTLEDVLVWTNLLLRQDIALVFPCWASSRQQLFWFSATWPFPPFRPYKDILPFLPVAPTMTAPQVLTMSITSISMFPPLHPATVQLLLLQLQTRQCPLQALLHDGHLWVLLCRRRRCW